MTEIPTEFVELAKVWHGGSQTMLYAVASTGGLTRGNIRPQHHDHEWDQSIRMHKSVHRPYSDDEWEWSLWSDLECELRSVLRLVDTTHDYFDELCRFHDFASQEADRLAVAHNIDI